MNYRKTSLLFLFAFCIYAKASAQKVLTPGQPQGVKPRLFKEISDSLPVNTSKLQPLLILKRGQVASIRLSDKFIFKGTVINSVNKYQDAIQTTIIKSVEYPDATLTISRVKRSDGSIVYRGRIISFQHGDCFELKNENGRYVFFKRNFEDMVNE